MGAERDLVARRDSRHRARPGSPGSLRLVFAILWTLALLIPACGENPSGDGLDPVVSGTTTLAYDYDGLDLSGPKVIPLDPGVSAYLDSIAKVDVQFKRSAPTPGVGLPTSLTLIGSPEGVWSGFNCGFIVGDCYFSRPDTAMPAVCPLGEIDLTRPIEAPETGYVSMEDSVAVGQAFAVITQDGKYGLLRVTAASEEDRQVTFDWLYQTDGSRLFR